MAVPSDAAAVSLSNQNGGAIATGYVEQKVKVDEISESLVEGSA